MRKKLLSISLFLLVLTYQAFAQDIVSGGLNSWLLHTPDDGRTTMFVAPLINNDWAWQFKTQFLNNGNVIFSGNITTQGNIGIGTETSASRLHIGCGNNEGILIGNYNDKLGWDGSSSQPGYHIRFAGYRDVVSNFTGARISALRTNQCSNALAQGMELVFSVSQGGVAPGDANLIEAIRINSVGNVGIGTVNPTFKLDVAGTIRAREIKVGLNGADIVFEKDYKLMPLNELEQFIKEQKHLPEVTSAKEMKENGTNLGNLNSKLLQKMEEMTLYVIEQNKKLEQQNQEMKEMKEKIKKLETASK